MLGDQQEASALILERMKATSVDEVYDALLIPSLNYTRRDLLRDYLTDDDQRMIMEGMRKTLLMVDEYAHPLAAKALSSSDPQEHSLNTSTALQSAIVLGCPARDDTDDAGLEMLRQLLNPARCILDIASVDSLVSELVVRIAKNPPVAICIASLPPGGMSHARYLCKRMRDAAPEMQIIVGRWGPNGVSKLDRERLVAAGANSVTTTLLETRKLIESRMPLLPSEPLASIAS